MIAEHPDATLREIAQVAGMGSRAVTTTQWAEFAKDVPPPCLASRFLSLVQVSGRCPASALA